MSNAEFPEAFEFLFEPARYKCAYGGRGGGKSQNFARALLIQGAQQKLRILCARETMNSLADSVAKLLADQIVKLGLQAHYTVQKSTILGSNGTEFLFAGLKHNVDAVKSMEGVQICWLEEASSISKASFNVVIPTIRKPGSEIWVSFNPSLESDFVWEYFVKNPPPDSIIRKINWDQNPWFPEVLRKEMEHLKATNEAAWHHVWEGHCKSVADGAIYAAELRAAETDGRITRVPYDRTRPVDVYWDLGYGDATALWFAQAFPFEYRLIDYLESSGKTIDWYLQQMQQKSYLYGTDWLPWDLGLHAKQMGSGRSIEELMRLAGRKVRITPKLSRTDGINAARTIFPQCWFDREKCADGLQALRHYRYEEVEEHGIKKREPLHDFSSHGSDAFRYFAVAAKAPRREAGMARPEMRPAGADAWMA